MIDVLKRSKDPKDSKSILDAIVATDIHTIVGPVKWTGQPLKNVCTTPVVAGQWQKHGDRLDIATPVPEFGFSGLEPGDRWCLCAPRWQEAFKVNRVPRVVLRATHEGALAHCSLADLKRFAVDLA